MTSRVHKLTCASGAEDPLVPVEDQSRSSD